MTEGKYGEIPPGFANEMGQVVGRISGSGSRKRPAPHSFDPTHVQHQASSHKQKSSASSTAMPEIPLGSSINAPLLIIDEEPKDTKINLNPLSLLSPPPNPRLQINDFSSPHINEESKTIISHVKSVLVFQLTSGSTKSIEAMVKCANNAFSNLDFLEADYSSFYSDIRDFIAYHYDLLTAKKQREMHSFPAELKMRYENAIICANDLKDKIAQTQGHMAMVIKKKEDLENQIADAMELVGKLKECVTVLKQEEGALKCEEKKCVAAYVIANREVQKISIEAEAAKNVLWEIDQRENAALNGIESTFRRLKSIQS